MEANIIDRVKLLIDKKFNGSTANFARNIGVAQTTANNYILGTRKPSVEFICAIVDSLNEVSAEWLMRGQGDMELSHGVIEKAINKFASMIPDCGNGDIFEAMYDEAQAEIKRLKVENARLKQQLDSRLVADNGSGNSNMA